MIRDKKRFDFSGVARARERGYSTCLTRSPSFTGEGLGSSISSFVSDFFSVTVIFLVANGLKTSKGR